MKYKVPIYISNNTLEKVTNNSDFIENIRYFKENYKLRYFLFNERPFNFEKKTTNLDENVIDICNMIKNYNYEKLYKQLENIKTEFPDIILTVSCNGPYKILKSIFSESIIEELIENYTDKFDKIINKICLYIVRYFKEVLKNLDYIVEIDEDSYDNLEEHHRELYIKYIANISKKIKKEYSSCCLGINCSKLVSLKLKKYYDIINFDISSDIVYLRSKAMNPIFKIIFNSNILEKTFDEIKNYINENMILYGHSNFMFYFKEIDNLDIKKLKFIVTIINNYKFFPIYIGLNSNHIHNDISKKHICLLKNKFPYHIFSIKDIDDNSILYNMLKNNYIQCIINQSKDIIKNNTIFNKYNIYDILKSKKLEINYICQKGKEYPFKKIGIINGAFKNHKFDSDAEIVRIDNFDNVENDLINNNYEAAVIYNQDYYNFFINNKNLKLLKPETSIDKDKDKDTYYIKCNKNSKINKLFELI